MENMYSREICNTCYPMNRGIKDGLNAVRDNNPTGFILIGYCLEDMIGYESGLEIGDEAIYKDLFCKTCSEFSILDGQAVEQFLSHVNDIIDKMRLLEHEEIPSMMKYINESEYMRSVNRYFGLVE